MMSKDMFNNMDIFWKCQVNYSVRAEAFNCLYIIRLSYKVAIR